MLKIKPIARKVGCKALFKAIFFIIIAINLITCNSRSVYNEKYTFEDYSWTQEEKITFNPEIKHAGIEYQAVIHIRYITGFSYKYLNFILIITHPDGSQSSKEISVQMLTDDKQYRGSGMGDIWDLDYELSEPIRFSEPGKYEIEIKPIMGEQPVNFINEIGVSLNKFD